MKLVADSAPPPPIHPAFAFLIGLVKTAWANPAIQQLIMSLISGLVAAPKTADPSASNCARVGFAATVRRLLPTSPRC